jgi:DNA polymerase I-like protein with 3'-5' exonuclease and polymerase domains
MKLKLPRNINLHQRIPVTLPEGVYFGSRIPDIVFVVDPITYSGDVSPSTRSPIRKPHFEFLSECCARHGVPVAKAGILRACAPVPAEVWDSQKRLSEFLKLQRGDVSSALLKLKPKLIVASGKSAASQVLNHSVKITQARGLPVRSEEFNSIVFPMLGVGHVLRVPETARIFEADMDTVGKIVKAGYSLSYKTDKKTDYSWITDLSPFIEAANAGPITLSLDTESVGLRWYEKGTKLLTVQFSLEEGKAYAVPIDYNFRNHGSPVLASQRAAIVRQLKTLLEHRNVRCFGQNLKHDIIMLRNLLGIEVREYCDDTMLLAHALDENMRRKDLDELARLYVPPMAGYADAFNRDPVHQKKTRMDLVPPDKMLDYGCGDVDACLRARTVMLRELEKDKKAYRCYRMVVMPAMVAFSIIEDYGFPIDKAALNAFENSLREHQEKERIRIYNMVPKAIREAELDKYVKRDKSGKITKPLNLTRRGFLVEMLFRHPKGLRLKPKVFTKSTAKLADAKMREPSVSGKQHLAYFKDDHPFVSAIMEYIKNEKLLGTYVGTESDDGETLKGFYRYIHNGRIRPTYWLSRTVTGRSASSDPNGQNFPKRGKLAKDYQRIFVAPPGYVILNCDFSQIELRIAAIMANEPYMLELYRNGKDIHVATAAAVMGISVEDFYKLPKDEQSLQRFRAKAVNFGFLYGMGWRKFMVYAKTEYDIEYTEEEAQEIRKTFFRMYRNLRRWHEQVRGFVQEHGYVRTFDGRVRHLPSVYSDDEAVREGAMRQAINSPVQAFGSDLGLMAMQLLVANVPFDLVRPIGFVHDAIVAIAPENKAMEAARTIKYWMENIPLNEWFGFTPPIPIIAEPSVGYNLADQIELEKDWLFDDKIKTFYDIQLKDWQARADKAKKKGERVPPKPQPKSFKRSKPCRLKLAPRQPPKAQKHSDNVIGKERLSGSSLNLKNSLSLPRSSEKRLTQSGGRPHRLRMPSKPTLKIKA